MKQLNNEITGEIIIIGKATENNTYYKRFENKYFADNKLFGIDNANPCEPYDLDYEFEGPLSVTKISDIKQLQIIASQPKVLEIEKDFVLSDDLKNWLILSRPIRLTMTNEFIMKELELFTPLAEIIIRITKENAEAQEKFIFKGEKGTVAYFNQMSEADAPIVTPYIVSGKIIMESL